MIYTTKSGNTFNNVSAKQKNYAGFLLGRIGDIMNIKNFTTMLLENIEESKLPVTEVERIQTDKSLFGISTFDDSQFLLKIAKRDALQESILLEMDEAESKIHEIYERFTNSWEYNNTLMNHDFDIDWLLDKLDIQDYHRLEKYILKYSSKNDELIFRLGFKYAWSLFTECMEPEKPTQLRKSKASSVSQT